MHRVHSEDDFNPAVLEKIKEVVREHPFWSYEQVADELRSAGVLISAIGVASALGMAS